MAYKFGLSQQFEREIAPKINGAVSQAILETMKSAADALISNIDTYWLGEGALNRLGVTGNAYTSVTIGVYQGKKLVYANWNGKHVQKPTMTSLAEGQPYPLPEYYDGNSVNEEYGPYVGEYGSGKQWGPQAGPWAIYSQRYNKDVAGKGFSMIVAIPMSYAGYNPRIVRAMIHIMDAIPSVIDQNIAKVNGGCIPSTTSFKDVPF